MHAVRTIPSQYVDGVQIYVEFYIAIDDLSVLLFVAPIVSHFLFPNTVNIQYTYLYAYSRSCSLWQLHYKAFCLLLDAFFFLQARNTVTTDKTAKGARAGPKTASIAMEVPVSTTILEKSTAWTDTGCPLIH